MDVERHVVTVGGAATQLPLKEFELLEMLLRNTGRVLTRMQLIDRIWGSDYVGDTKTLDVHVKRLRAKVEPTRPTPQAHRHRAGAGLQVRGLTRPDPDVARSPPARGRAGGLSGIGEGRGASSRSSRRSPSAARGGLDVLVVAHGRQDGHGHHVLPGGRRSTTWSVEHVAGRAVTLASVATRPRRADSEPCRATVPRRPAPPSLANGDVDVFVARVDELADDRSRRRPWRRR